MSIEFYKYQGTGNDFILFDNRAGLLRRNLNTWIARICDRRFGIGADGVIFLQNDADSDFEMVYYNADGGESSMCGNGGRCIVHFAHGLGIIKDHCTFRAADGLHEADIKGETVRLKMGDVKQVNNGIGFYTLNSGSPHYVEFIEDVQAADIKKEGAAIRYNAEYKTEGINVNFVELTDGGIKLRTYERGVEDETLSCGTGVTAAAIIYSVDNKFIPGFYAVAVETMGGHLQVTYDKISDQVFKNIWLIGNATCVFKGEIFTDLT